MTVKLSDDTSLFLMAAAVALGAIALNSGCAGAPTDDGASGAGAATEEETSESALGSANAVVLFGNGCSRAERDDDHYEHVKYSYVVRASKKGEYDISALLQTTYMPLGTRNADFDTAIYGAYKIEERTAKEINSILLTATATNIDTSGLSMTAIPLSNDCIGPSVEIARSTSCTASGSKKLVVTAQKSTKVAVNVYDHAGNQISHHEGEPKPARTTGAFFWKRQHPEEPLEIQLAAVENVGRVAVTNVSDDQASGTGIAAEIQGDCR